MKNEDAFLIAMSCGMLAAIFSYLIIYIYNKHSHKAEKWRAGILLVDYVFLAIIINSIIIALMTPLVSYIIININFFTASIISICILGFINALIGLSGKEFKAKGNKFLLHFAIIILIITFLNIFVAISNLKGINIFHLIMIILAILNFYYSKKLHLEDITSAKIKKEHISLRKTQDKYDTLQKLKTLYDSKAITKEEFEREKSKILR